MKPHLIACVALAAASLPLATAAQTDLSAIAAFVEESRETAHIPGLSIVMMQDGRVLRAWGDGVDAAGAPMTEDTRIYIGSASKAFTALAVMQLAESGRIDLDAPVRAALPEFSMNDPRADAITARQLLTHTSGMGDLTYQEWRWPQPRTPEQAVARLSGAHLQYDPASRFSYHNPNYAVAARLVEVVSGMPFDVYLRDHVFAPLGMTRTDSVSVLDDARSGAARGHIHAVGVPIGMPSPPFFVGGAGGVVTTAADMGRWLEAQANGGRGANGARILSEVSMRATHTGADPYPGYAIGWDVGRDGRIAHSGGLPGHSAYVLFYEGGDGVAVMTPAPFAGAQQIAEGALDILQGRTPPAPRASPMGRIDWIVALGVAAVWSLGVWRARGARSWASRMRGRPAWRLALGFAPQLVLAAAVLAGLPFLVSRVESWSWVWLFYWLPVWTVLFASVALVAALTAAAKLWALFRPAVRDTMAR